MKTEKDSKHGISSEVSWQLNSTTMFGTLVKPLGTGVFPAIVFVAGSGPTDRDWNSPLIPGSNGSASLIAEALASAGIASLRYDKRASGPHARENMQVLIGKISMQSHLDELAGAVRTLASQTYVRRDRIFGLGNSEGTLHILNYQLLNPEIQLAGLVLTGSPGRSIGAVARTQLAEQAASIPNSDALLKHYDTSIARWMAGESMTPDPSLPQAFQQVIQGVSNPANLPFARELWMANVAPLLEQVNVPVLVIFGKKDIQVDWQVDGEPLKKLLRDIRMLRFSFPKTRITSSSKSCDRGRS